MVLFIENVKLALTAIKSNKLRSFLTMLGIIIGISSVIAITSIGDSAKGVFTKEFEGLGAGYLYIIQNWSMNEDGYIDDTDLFTWDEIAAVKERFSDKINYIVPYLDDGGTVQVGKIKANVDVFGVDAHYDEYMTTIQIIHGRMINDTDVDKRKNAIVVSKDMAKRLYNRENIVGEKITLESKSNGFRDFLVIGVYEEPASIFSKFSRGEPTYNCFAPFPSVAAYEGEESYYLEVYANPEYNVQETGDEVCRWIEKIKGKPEGWYMTETAEASMSQVNSLLSTLSLAIGAIAAISLVVGGIGIMNIMLVSVTERTREIGIRKSLGARTKDILTQFLIEAMILSVIGGVIGTLFGVGIAGIGMAIAGISLVVNPVAVILAIGFSAGVGLFFGIFPAKKAAKLDPIEALRYE